MVNVHDTDSGSMTTLRAGVGERKDREWGVHGVVDIVSYVRFQENRIIESEMSDVYV